MIEEARQRMLKSIVFLKSELAQIRTGRASPALLENVTVDTYGSKMKLVELAQISAPDPKQLLISPWDKTIIADIGKGIEAANVGLTPIVEEEVIRINIPPLTEERRKEFTKIAHQKAEMTRVGIRSIRHDTLSELKRKKDSGDVSEDEKERLEKQLQELVEEMIDEVDVLVDKKEEELLQV